MGGSVSVIHCILIVGVDRLDSGLRMIASAQHENVKLYIIWRGFDSVPNTNFIVEYEVALKKCTLSEGRNVLLQYIFSSRQRAEADVICFADDDGTWPNELPNLIIAAFEDSIPWALGVYAPTKESLDLERFPKTPKSSLTTNELLARGSSLGIYGRANVMKEIGFFDTKLGLGNRISIGEDIDYILRLKFFSHQSPYRPALFQYHNYGNEQNVQRQRDSLDFLLHMKKKEMAFSAIFFKRLLSLLLKRKINLRETQRYAFSWLLHRRQ